MQIVKLALKRVLFITECDGLLFEILIYQTFNYKKRSQMKNIVIIGAGINGLALACALAEAGLTVSVLDRNVIAGDRVGRCRGESCIRPDSLRVSALTPSSFDFLENLNIKKNLDLAGLSYFYGMKVWGPNNLDGFLKPDLDLEA